MMLMMVGNEGDSDINGGEGGRAMTVRDNNSKGGWQERL